MSYKDLANRLEYTAHKIRSNLNQLGGEELNKKANTLHRDLRSFETKLDEVLVYAKPGIKEFETLINSDRAKELLRKKEAIAVLYRRLFDESPTRTTAAQIRKEILTQVKMHDSGSEAVNILKNCLKDLSRPMADIPTDQEKLQKEFFRLGSLSDEEYAYEMKTRFTYVGPLRKLAKANGINASGMKRKQLEQKIRHNAKRAYDHIYV